MRFTRSKPTDHNVPFSPTFFCKHSDSRAPYVDWESPEVKECIYGKPNLSLKQSLKKQLEPITRPLVKTLEPITRPFVLSTSNPYPADTDVPVVRVAKKVARLGRPKKLRLLRENERGLKTFPPSPLVHRPSQIVPPTCYTLVETRDGYFVEKKERMISAQKVKRCVSRVGRRISQSSS